MTQRTGDSDKDHKRPVTIMMNTMNIVAAATKYPCRTMCGDAVDENRSAAPLRVDNVGLLVHFAEQVSTMPKAY